MSAPLPLKLRFFKCCDGFPKRSRRFRKGKRQGKEKNRFSFAVQSFFFVTLQAEQKNRNKTEQFMEQMEAATHEAGESSE